MDVEAAAEAAEELRRLVHAESFPTGNGPPFSLAVAERGGVVSASVAETNR